MHRVASTSAVLLAALLLSSCGGGNSTDRRVVVLGFDGMDYGVASELIAAGRMPNFARLAAEGSFGPLETSIPPQSPVAWSNFTTGMDSGGHGIYDFLRRDPETMALAESTTLVESGGLKLSIGRYQFPLSGDSVELLRRGRAFWEVLEDHGIETTVIRMPANFPPSETASRELSGMGTPDLPGTLGTFSFYTSRLFAFRGQDISGGAVYEVDVVDNTVEANLYGPENPFLIEPELAVSPFTVYLDPVDPVAKLVVGSEERVLRAGEWTDWIPADFDLIPTQVVTGMARFYLRSVRPDFELYVTPVNIDPLNPAAPVSYPDDFAAELADATGRLYTQGMPEDTKALQAGVLSIDEFLAQAKITGDEIVAQYKYVLGRYENGFLFYYFG
ncbi:MAG: alkaline phosphatase family protein, partial [Gammaproteobacteria bacterium]|nr:alkaline phosphatase family protein [Gammaproteobacteria bacterium]